MFRHTAILILPALSQALDTCKALVLSGGGANGAWEAGIFWGLNNYGNSGDFDY
jgi:predicted acylesterase/phospholipase RssA